MALQTVTVTSSCAGAGLIPSLGIGTAAVQSIVAASSIETSTRPARTWTLSAPGSCRAAGTLQKEFQRKFVSAIAGFGNPVFSGVDIVASSSVTSGVGGPTEIERWLDSLYGSVLPASTLANLRVSAPVLITLLSSSVPSSGHLDRAIVKQHQGSVNAASTLTASKVQTHGTSTTGTVTGTSSLSLEQINQTLLDSFFFWLRHRR